MWKVSRRYLEEHWLVWYLQHCNTVLKFSTNVFLQLLHSCNTCRLCQNLGRTFPIMSSWVHSKLNWSTPVVAWRTIWKWSSTDWNLVARFMSSSKNTVSLLWLRNPHTQKVRNILYFEFAIPAFRVRHPRISCSPFLYVLSKTRALSYRDYSSQHYPKARGDQ